MRAGVHPSRSSASARDDEWERHHRDDRDRRYDAAQHSGDDGRRTRRGSDSYSDRRDEDERRSRRREDDSWSDHRRRREGDDDERERRAPSSSSSDPIRFLSSIRLEQQPAASSSSSAASTSRSPAATAFVMIRSLPSSCDEAALHGFCLPFHCRSHRFLPPASPPASTRDCLVEFSDASWASQFVAIFRGKPMLRAAGHAAPLEMAFVPSRDAAELLGRKRRREEADDDATDARRDSEEGEVKEEDSWLLAPSLRRPRLRAQYDFSTLAALTGSPSAASFSSSAIVASQLPSAFNATTSALSDVVRYAIAPFAGVEFVHLQRLEDSHAVVALVVLHSEEGAQAVMQRKADIRIMKEQIDLHFAHRRQPAWLASQPEQSAATATLPSSSGPSLLSSLLSSVSSAAADGAAVRPAHLPATYVFQPESGFWSDSASTLSFHPSSGLYYDATTALYYMWSAATQQYAAVQPQAQQTAASAAEASALTPAATTDASSPAFPAAASASPSLPPQTASTPAPIRLSLSALSTRPAASIRAARPALFAVADEAATEQPAAGQASQSESHSAPPAAASASAALESTAVGNNSSSSSTAVSVDELLSSPLFEVSAARIACLLCQRGFASAEQLRRHVEQSQLHANNLKLQQTQTQPVVYQPQPSQPAVLGHQVDRQLQKAAAAPATAADSGGGEAAKSAAARHYLALLEQSREQSSEQSEHRRPLLK